MIVGLAFSSMLNRRAFFALTLVSLSFNVALLLMIAYFIRGTLADPSSLPSAASTRSIHVWLLIGAGLILLSSQTGLLALGLARNRSRRHEFALLRMLGAHPRTLAGLAVCEMLIITLCACLSGFALLGGMLAALPLPNYLPGPGLDASP